MLCPAMSFVCRNWFIILIESNYCSFCHEITILRYVCACSGGTKRHPSPLGKLLMKLMLRRRQRRQQCFCRNENCDYKLLRGLTSFQKHRVKQEEHFIAEEVNEFGIGNKVSGQAGEESYS